MSKERLSRLQKWILEELYIEWERTAAMKPDRAFWRRQVFHRAWEDGLFKRHEKTAVRPNDASVYSSQVIFSRSIWRLIEAGYLSAEGPATPLPIMMKSFKKFGDVEGKAVTEKIFEDNPFALMEPGQAVPAQSRRGWVRAKVIWLADKGKEKAKELLAAREVLKVKKDKLTIRTGEP